MAFKQFQTTSNNLKHFAPMPTGKLYLIPSSISDDNHLVVSLNTVGVLKALHHFIVEKETTARRFLRATGRSLDDIEMTVLDEHTPLYDLPALLQPLLEGNNTGLISEAGAPAVADPGSELI